LSIKDDIHNIEEKLSSEDKIFEGSVKLERLFKRYKKLILMIAVALIGLLVTSQVMNYVENNRINNLNTLYSKAIDENSIKNLEKESKNLAIIAKFNLNKNSEEVANSNLTFISTLAKYEIAIQKQNDINLEDISFQKDNLVKDFSKLNQAIILYKNGNFKKSKLVLDSIQSQELENLINILKHSLISKLG
jgi:hypothetical protein